MLEIVPVTTTDVVHIRLSGQITTDRVPQLEHALEQALDQKQNPRCVLDLAGLTYTGSGGLRIILVMAKRIRNAGGRLVICGAQSSVLTVFEMSGFTRFLAFEPDFAAARDRVLAG